MIPWALVATAAACGAITALASLEVGVREVSPERHRRAIARAPLLVVAAALAASVAASAFAYSEAPAVALSHAVLAALVTAAARIDLAFYALPNALTLGGAALALAASAARGRLGEAALGLALALVVMAAPAWIYQRVRGHGGVGLGDTKLVMLAGAWLGPRAVVFVVAAAALQSTLCALALRAAGVTPSLPRPVREELDELRRLADGGDETARAILAADPLAAPDGGGVRAMRLPMGPFLALASLEALWLGPHLARWLEALL